MATYSSPPQLTASTNPDASASHFNVLLFITLSPQWVLVLLEKLPRDIESEIPVVAIEAAARHLRHRRTEAVREVDLKRMPAGAHFDTETGVDDARVVAEPRRGFGHEVQLRANS